MKKSILVPDMMCHNCENRLAALADKLSGIKFIAATHENHIMEVEFDETKLSLDEIVTAVTNLGFHPELTKLDFIQTKSRL
jgi:copper chaperone CopZ